MAKTLKASQCPSRVVIACLTHEFDKMTDRLKDWHKASEASRWLADIPGFGVLVESYVTQVLCDGAA